MEYGGDIMANTFPTSVQPVYPVNRKTKMRALTARFGDGYSQRAEDGINATVYSWDVTYENLTTAEKDTIVNFLEGEKGVNVFLWTPPRESTQYKVICQEWNTQLVEAVYWNVTATFTREFDQ